MGLARVIGVGTVGRGRKSPGALSDSVVTQAIGLLTLFNDDRAKHEVLEELQQAVSHNEALLSRIDDRLKVVGGLDGLEALRLKLEAKEHELDARERTINERLAQTAQIWRD